MSSRVAYYAAAFAAILTLNVVLQVKGQTTLQDDENGDLSIKQVQSMQDVLTESLQDMKRQLETVLKSLETIGRRLDEHDISVINKTQNSWKIEIAYGSDFGEVPILSAVNNWIVLMHRFDGSLNFYRNWTEYRNGFGDIRQGEFWLGNEKIHRLTNRFSYTLRIEVQLNATGRWFYADYATFSLDSEDNKYALRLSGYSGNAGDSLTNTSLTINGMNFTTLDADNDRRSGHNCAKYFEGAWWFDDCWFACLTCHYKNNFRWHYYGGWESSGALRAARMMIKSS